MLGGRVRAIDAHLEQGEGVEGVGGLARLGRGRLVGVRVRVRVRVKVRVSAMATCRALAVALVISRPRGAFHSFVCPLARMCVMPLG